MRTRTRDAMATVLPTGQMKVAGNTPQICPLSNGEYPLYVTPGAVYKTGSIEQITDQLTADYRALRRRHNLPFNPVNHNKLLIGPPGSFETSMLWRNHANLTLVGTTLPIKNRVDAILPATIPPTDSTSLAEAMADALRKTQSQDGTSLFNFLVELSEIRQLAQAVSQPVIRAKNIFDKAYEAGYRSRSVDRIRAAMQLESSWGLGKAPTSMKGVSIKDLLTASKQAARWIVALGPDALKATATAWLTNSFAIQPFLRDLKSFEKAIDRVGSLKRRIAMGQPIRTRSTKRVPINAERVTYVTTGCPSLDSQSYVDVRTEVSVSATCTATYSTDSMSLIDEASAYANALGLFPTATRLYNAIPYSFAWDYFIRLSDYIDMLDGREHIIEPISEVIWTGLKVRKIGTFVMVPHEPYGSSSEDRVITGSKPAIVHCERGWYTRQVGAALNQPAPIRHRLPSLRQGVNLAALAVNLLSDGVIYKR